MKRSIQSEYITEIYDYKGLWDVPSRCGLKVVEKSGKVIVIATELYQDNPGTSITNCSAKLAHSICQDKKITPEALVFIEHSADMGSKLEFYGEKFFRVEFQKNHHGFSNPKWIKVSKEEVEQLIK